MIQRSLDLIWIIVKILMFISCVNYLLIAVQYSYFDGCASFPLQNTTGIVNQLLTYGSTDATPLNKIHIDTKLIYNTENVCVNPISLLIVVKSAVDNFGRRNAIRRTWGKFIGTKTKIVFILGYNHTLIDLVNQEYHSYSDIVQGNFIDTYANNTYKTILSYNWIFQYCVNTDHVLFVDDDFFVHIPNVLQYVDAKNVDKTGDIMYGRLFYMARPKRLKGSKWYISESEYPFDFWPPYLGGGSILTTVQVVKKIVLAMPYIRYVWIDDAFVGIVANKIGIKLVHEPGFYCSGKIKPNEINGYLTSHEYDKHLDLILAYKETTLHNTSIRTVPWHRLGL